MRWRGSGWSDSALEDPGLTSPRFRCDPGPWRLRDSAVRYKIHWKSTDCTDQGRVKNKDRQLAGCRYLP